MTFPKGNENPLEIFHNWFEEAKATISKDPNAMALATCHEGKPLCRIVLLKKYDENGFIFFTNYNSQKGKQLIQNPHSELNFYWRELDKQIRIKGIAKKTSEQESDEYFASRPRDSQIGAWASDQSSPLKGGAEALLKNVEKQKAKFKDAEIIPRPPHWGGFRVQPLSIEFWHQNSFRLHQRIRFEREDFEQNWQAEFLNP